MDQPKIERLLRLMRLMTGNTRYSISNLARRLDISERSVYRYIDTFRAAGFVIKQNGDCYRLDKSSPYFKDISQLVHFTNEEAYLLKSAIESIDENNLIKQNLRRKLYAVYDYKVLAQVVVHGKNSKNVHALVEAMEQKCQVVLKDYSSAYSGQVADRLVEPFTFTTNYIQLWAYEPASGRNKLYKVSRIGSVSLQGPWCFESQHKEGYMDVFRMSGFEQIPVHLRLGSQAAHILIEEYPLAEREMSRFSDTQWDFKTAVCAFEGVGRFVMGLLDDIEVMGPQSFKDYLRTRKRVGDW